MGSPPHITTYISIKHKDYNHEQLSRSEDVGSQVSDQLLWRTGSIHWVGYIDGDYISHQRREQRELFFLLRWREIQQGYFWNEEPTKKTCICRVNGKGLIINLFIWTFIQKCPHYKTLGFATAIDVPRQTYSSSSSSSPKHPSLPLQFILNISYGLWGIP